MSNNKVNRYLVTVRDNAWLTLARAERWSLIFVAGYLAFFVALFGTAHGMNDFMGRPVGADFSSFYTAGRIARLGGNPYDQVALHAAQKAMFGTATPFYGFAYPPVFLLMLVPLSLLSYPAALAAWQIGTLAFYLICMDRLRISQTYRLPRYPFLLISLAFTATFVSLANGQNGLLMAGIFALALAYLSSRPLLAGVCFGFLILKPQLGLLIPFALVAGGHWRPFAALSLTVMLLAAISYIAFGPDIWPGFLGASQFSRVAILDDGGVGYGKMVSAFAGLRSLGLPLLAAYIFQALAATAAAVGIVAVWRAPVDARLKGAGLCFGTLIATPFALDYDMMILAPGIALIVAMGIERGFRPFEGMLLVLGWMIPMFVRIDLVIRLPIAFLINFCIFASILVRTHHRHGS